MIAVLSGIPVAVLFEYVTPFMIIMYMCSFENDVYLVRCASRDDSAIERRSLDGSTSELLYLLYE